MTMTMTTVIKNKKGLTLETTPAIHRKYLGEPEDPHFIPSSPLIDRAVFTAQEEGELKRLCALALANVPHSDEPEPVTVRKPEPQVPRKYKVAGGEVNEVKLPQPHFVDTRTPSEASKRDTFGTTTDHSTPLTSAGITPGEPVKRPIDSMKGPSVSKGPTNNSNLRFDSWQQAFQRAKANTHPPSTKRLQPVDPRKTVELRNSTASAPVSAERTLRFVTDSPRDSSVSQPNPIRSSDFNRTKRFSQAELNKKLPPLPKDDDEDAEKGPKTATLNRIFRNMGRKKNNQHDEDDCEPLTGSESRPRTAPGYTKSAPASPAMGTEGKKKISSKIRMFGRKDHDRPTMSRGVTVP